MNSLTSLTLAGDDVDDVGGGDHSTPSTCTDRELLSEVFRREDTVVMTMIVGLKTNSVIVNKLNPRYIKIKFSLI